MFNRKLTFTPLVLEVVGEMDDVTVKQVLDLLHSYRSRYSPLFRLLCTLTSVSHSNENEMFERFAEKAETQLHCSDNMQKSAHTPLYALSIAHLNNNHIPVIKRFHTIINDSNTKHLLLTSSSIPKSHHSDCESEMCTFYTKRLSNTQTSVIDQLETFMSYYFLPLCITHNFMSELIVESDKGNMMHKYNKCQDANNLANGIASTDNKEESNKQLQCSSSCPMGEQSCEEEEQLIQAQTELKQSSVNSEANNTRRLLNLHDIDHFILRHYVHETTRTCSFLVADTASHQAALIDPQCNINEYVNDLHKFDLNLAVIIYTHCPVDIAIGVDELQTQFPTCTIIGGLAEESNAGKKETYPLSSTLSLRTTNIPSFAPESLIVELFVQEICVALFTGTALSTDSLPSTSFYCFYEALQEQCNSHTDQELRESAKQQQQQFTSSSSPPLEQEQNTNNTSLFKCLNTITNSQRVMQIAQHNLKTYLYDTFLGPIHKIDMSRQGSNSNVCKKEKYNWEREQQEQEELLQSNEEKKEMPKLYKNKLEEEEEEEEELEKSYNARQQIIIFPARGGYNNGVTNQLDLYWAVSVRDFTHMSHSQRVVEAMTSFDKYVKLMKQTSNNEKQNNNEWQQQEHFPHRLYKSIWKYNYNALWKAHMSNSALSVKDGSNRKNTNKVKLHVNEENKSRQVSEHEKTNNCNSKLSTCVSCKMHPSCHYTLVIDVRPLPEYEEWHVKYSIHIPMNFPATVFNAKKAELWLQNLLLPHCSVLVICSTTNNKSTTTTIINNTTTKAITFCMKDEIAKRFRLIAPSINLRVCTAEEIDEIIQISYNAHNKHSVECDNNICDGNCNVHNNNNNDDNSVVVVANSTVKCCERWQPLEWVYGSAQKNVFSRVTTSEELLQINLCHCKRDKSNGFTTDKHQHLEELSLHNNNSRCCAHYTVMVDIRTHAEFKNGSHVNSIHIPLGEMCEEVIQDVLNSHEYNSDNIDSMVDQTCNGEVDTYSSSHVVNKNTQECFVYVPSIHLAKRFLHNLHNQAERTKVHVCVNANELKRIVLYCASGYRTLIAASILQRAFDAAAAASTQAKAEQAQKHCKCNLGDTHDGEFLECVKQIQIQDVKGGALQIMTQRPDLWLLKDRSIICISWPH